MLPSLSWLSCLTNSSFWKRSTSFFVDCAYDSALASTSARREVSSARERIPEGDHEGFDEKTNECTLRNGVLCGRLVAFNGEVNHVGLDGKLILAARNVRRLVDAEIAVELEEREHEVLVEVPRHAMRDIARSRHDRQCPRHTKITARGCPARMPRSPMTG